VLGGEVSDHAAQVTQFAVCIDETRLFLTGLAITNEFHEIPLLRKT